MVILVAGLQVIPKDYDEAAEVFGATPLAAFRHVTLPLLRPSLQDGADPAHHPGLQVFAVAQALAGRNLPLLVGETYQWYFDAAEPERRRAPSRWSSRHLDRARRWSTCALLRDAPETSAR